MTIIVTDHALLRYVERVHGVDLEELRRRLREQIARSADVAAALGQRRYTIRAEGWDYLVIDGHCITVLEKRLGRLVREGER